MKLAALSATELLGMLGRGETSSREIMLSALREIEAREPSLNAFITLRDPQELLDEAGAADDRRSRGEATGPLAGLPIAIKDSLSTKGLRTTCASRMLERYVPPFDATCVARIRQAGGIIIGKTNMDEFCMGSSTENSIAGPSRNPHNPDYVTGGTSGGSAAAVAASECAMAIGSDTGGSVRQPASFCGVVGIKPTYGRISRYGLVAYASSLDQVGVLARGVADAALMLGVIAGPDPRDSTCIDAPAPDYTVALGQRRKYRIGVPAEYLSDDTDPEVTLAVERAIALMKASGHETVPISLGLTEYVVPTYYIIACAEASSNLARYDGVRYTYRADGGRGLRGMYEETRARAFSPEVKRRIMLGTYVLSSGYYDAYYLKASRVRTMLINEMREAFTRCDLIVNPVAPAPAFRLGEKVDDPLKMYLSDIFSAVANLTGLPAISIPCGTNSLGLPIGVQLTARALDEPGLLSAAHMLEGLLASG